MYALREKENWPTKFTLKTAIERENREDAMDHNR